LNPLGDRPQLGQRSVDRQAPLQASDSHVNPLEWIVSRGRVVGIQTSVGVVARESWLLKLLADGHHRKTAAHEMRISVDTVSFHLKRIYEKLQVHSKTEAVAKALRERLV
jgi:DNA-binding NarL/FixJ family response regulator